MRSSKCQVLISYTKFCSKVLIIIALIKKRVPLNFSYRT